MKRGVEDVTNKKCFGRKLFRTISGVVGIIHQIRIQILSSWKLFPNNNSFFLCVRGSITQNVTSHVHVFGACFHTCVDQMQTHSGQTQITYTAQTHRISMPTVIVSLMIHDNMYLKKTFVFKYMNMCVHV